MNLGIGIIGYGYMGHKHAKMLSGADGVCLIGICDIAEERFSDVPEGIFCCTSSQELLVRPEIQVVVVTVNSSRHKQLILEAAAAGKDVICEMPVALYVSDFDSIVRGVGAHGRQLTVCEYRRFDRDFLTAKQLYDSRTLGDLYVIKSYLYTFSGRLSDWRSQMMEGGGILYDWGVHLLDQLLDLVEGKVRTVYAATRRVVNDEVEDYFNVILRFENGIVAEIEVGTHHLSDKESWFGRHWYLGGNQGAAYIDGFSASGRIVRMRPDTRRCPEDAARQSLLEGEAAGPIGADEKEPGERLQSEELPVVQRRRSDFYRNYLRARAGEESFSITVPEARRVLRLLEAVRKSSQSGQTVLFEG